MEKKAAEISSSRLIRSAMSDNEISDYLNTKKEIELKTALWELMYKDFFEKKKQKGSGKKKAKSDGRNNNSVTEKLENKRKREDKVPMRPEKSSKINYDALKRLRGEFGDGEEPGPGDGEEERFRESEREEEEREEKEERGGYGYEGGEGYYNDGGYGGGYYEEDDEEY